MNKLALIKKILIKLEMLHQGAVDAAQRAYETATDEENEAENKYDTLGLEASYLAHGQSKRVAECENDLIVFKKFKPNVFSNDMPIDIGALVSVEDEAGLEQLVFISPVSGGLKFIFNRKQVTMVTPSSPLGSVLLNHSVGDYVVSLAGNNKRYQIIAVY